MPLFEYYEREDDNKISSGYVKAESKEEAKASLKQKGVKILRIDEIAGRHAQVVDRINNLKNIRSKAKTFNDGYAINYDSSPSEIIPKTHINYAIFIPILIVIALFILNYYT